MSRTENMIVVIQCAGGKQKDAGHMKDAGRKVLFVADPASAPQSDSVIYKRPDDAASSGRSCRDMLEDYNRNRRKDNPLDLFPAWELYTKPAYRELAEYFGIGNLYILSAGWGLVKADYLLPKYDITFSTSVGRLPAPAKAGPRLPRLRHATRNDFGACRVPGWERLRPALPAPDGQRRSATVVFNSKTPPRVPGCELKRYQSRTRTNWHYECAKKLVSGEFTVC